MVILYKGAFCRFPRKEEIIAVGAEEDWVDLVRANGIEPELDFHFAFDGHNPYVDFEGVRAQAAIEAGRLLSWLN